MFFSIEGHHSYPFKSYARQCVTCCTFFNNLYLLALTKMPMESNIWFKTPRAQILLFLVPKSFKGDTVFASCHLINFVSLGVLFSYTLMCLVFPTLICIQLFLSCSSIGIVVACLIEVLSKVSLSSIFRHRRRVIIDMILIPITSLFHIFLLLYFIQHMHHDLTLFIEMPHHWSDHQYQYLHILVLSFHNQLKFIYSSSTVSIPKMEISPFKLLIHHPKMSTS